MTFFFSLQKFLIRNLLPNVDERIKSWEISAKLFLLFSMWWETWERKNDSFQRTFYSNFMSQVHTRRRVHRSVRRKNHIKMSLISDVNESIRENGLALYKIWNHRQFNSFMILLNVSAANLNVSLFVLCLDLDNSLLLSYMIASILVSYP